MLLAVRDQIPPWLMLPRDPVKNLWYYYTTFHCSAIIHDDNLIILVPLPLLDSSGRFDIYQVTSMPVPYPPSNLTAVYTLEFQYFGISKDRTQYVVLKGEEMGKCGLKGIKFCPLNAPVYVVNERETCVISLFLRKAAEIKRLCQATVSTAKLPRALRLDKENWLLALLHVTWFTFLCQDDHTYEVEAKPPIALLYVPVGCRAYSTVMALPMYVSGRTNFNVKNPEDSLLKMYNYSMVDIWEPLCQLNDTLDPLNILAPLQNIRDVPLNYVFNQLRRHAGMPVPGAGVFPYRGAAVVGIITILVVVRRKLKGFIEVSAGSLRGVYSPANTVTHEHGDDEGVLVNRLGPPAGHDPGDSAELSEAEHAFGRHVGSAFKGAEGARGTESAP